VTDAADPPVPPRPPVAPFGEPLVDVHVVAAYFACDPATVYRLARRAALPAIEVAPRVLRFRPTDVRAFLAERERKAAPRGRVKRLLGTTP